MFNKKKSTPDGGKIKNTVALKRSIYAVALSVIFIAGIIFAVVLSTFLAERYPLQLDLTADKQHSITGDNLDFIKGVDKKVNIYVCLTEEEYDCSSTSSYNMCYYAAQNYFVDYNTDNAKYFSQTVELLRKYEKYNDNISLTFLDIAQPSANEITDNFSDYSWTTGDILVESTFTVNGKEITRRTAIPFNEVYTLKAGHNDTENYKNYASIYGNYALYGYGVGYLITENNIEYAVSAAVYKVVSETTPVFLVPSTYCNAESVSEQLEGMLEANNFSIEYKEGLISTVLTAENYDKYEGVILSSCSSDISSDDRIALEAFLNNDGKKGKSMFYFAGTNTYKLTNLCAFLGDWGIGFEQGILYETTKDNHIAENPTSFYYESLETDYTETADALSGMVFTATNSVPMKVIYTNNTTATYIRSSTVALRTGSNGTVTVMPVDADYKTWTPAEDAEKDAYPTVIVTEDSATLNDEYVYSSVTAVASADFISKSWSQYTNIANLNATLDIVNFVTGSTENPFNFIPKTITNEKFYISEKTSLTLGVVFIGVIPLLLIAGGIIIWVRRRSR
jgi:hypothetical protein